jgi:hypothetical protein
MRFALLQFPQFFAAIKLGKKIVLIQEKKNKAKMVRDKKYLFLRKEGIWVRM